ncbi:MAG: PDDEXK nuclease domain-containing protein [bacterium]|nr:PDDEXK nuclease domain-containing protein [bacterium]
MNYYNEIKNKLIDNEVYSKVKDYSKERHKVITYFEIGRLLNEAGGKYGDNIIDEYSKKLVQEVGKKYNKRTLFRMRQFYNVFSDEKVSTMSTQLSWSHYTELLPIKDISRLLYYLNVCIRENIDVRTLREKIKLKEYERLPEDTKYKLINKEETSIVDYVKNPIRIKNNKNYEIVTEKILQKLILEDIPTFLKELGSGFTFIDNEYKIKLGDRYNYIDLLLYNIKYKCYVVIELKITELKKQYTGQIMTYMNYIDKNIKTIEENKTVGIIICKQDNEYVIKYCSDDRIIAREYQLL